jgi:type IV secretory pathway component VirB8
MRAPLQLFSPAQPASALDEGAAKRHLATSTARADQVITLNRAFRTAGWIVGAAGMAVGLVGLGVAAMVIARDAPAVPAFNTISPEGRIERALSVDEVPTRFTEVTSRQYLQMAVEYCEGYHFQTRETDAPRCGLFLAPAQRARFAEYYEGADGPPRRLGQRGSVEVVRPSYTPTGKGAQNTEAWTVRFLKRETARDGALLCMPWQLTIQFQWRPELRMTPTDRNTNAAGFQAFVWEGQPDPSGRPGSC